MPGRPGNRMSSIGNMGLLVSKGACSEALFHVLNRHYGHPMAQEERASQPLVGGLMMQGYQCGQIWGAALAAGAQACRVYGRGAPAQAGAIAAAARVIDAFRRRSAATDCFDITDLSAEPSKSQLLGLILKGRYARCFRIIAKYPQLAADAIDEALREEPADAPPEPVGCAAAVARRMGASDTDTTIAAGLAGGIGLSGGGCGALGAAVWLTGLSVVRAGATRVGFTSPKTVAVLDRFLKAANYEYECSAIVARRFESVADHARYICEGGCSKILDALAAP